MKITFFLILSIFMMVSEKIYAGKKSPSTGLNGLSKTERIEKKLHSPQTPLRKKEQEKRYSTPSKKDDVFNEERQTPFRSSAKKYGDIKQYIGGLLSACPEKAPLIQKGEAQLEKYFLKSCKDFYIPTFTQQNFLNCKDYNLAKLRGIEQSILQESLEDSRKELLIHEQEILDSLAALGKLTASAVDSLFESALEKGFLSPKGIFDLRDHVRNEVDSLGVLVQNLNSDDILEGLKRVSYESLKACSVTKTNSVLQYIPQLICVKSLKSSLESVESKVARMKEEEDYLQNL